MVHRLFTIIVLSLLLAACSNDNKAGTKDDADSGATAEAKNGADATESSAEDADKRFQEESGIVEMTNLLMPGMTMTLYFDDYGRKQATVVNMDVAGQKSEAVTINVDGYITQYSSATNTGKRTKIPEGTSGFASGNFAGIESMSAEEKQKYNYKELESKTVAGKEAKGFSLEMGGQAMKVWAWNGVPVAIEMASPQGTITMEATKIDTDTDVPDDRFKVPEGITITDG